MRAHATILTLAAALAGPGCGPPRQAAPAPVEPAGPAAQDATLPEGKKPAAEVTPPPGTLLTRVDAEQLDMVYAPEGAFSPAKRLERAMEDSTTAFRNEPIGTKPSGFHDLFGGVREPDPFLVVHVEGNVRYGKPYPADPDLLEELEKLLTGIQAPEEQDEAFCEALEALAGKDPSMPVLNERLAGCYQAIGRMEDALRALEKELEVNPSHPGAHLGLAAAAAGAGKSEEARSHVVRALLYYPAFEQPRKWVNSGGLAGTRARVERFAPRVSLEVDEAGFVVARSAENQPWAGAWAGCKAGFRYAPEVRMAFGMTSGAYKPSLLEEMVCLRLAADAYADGRADGRPAEVAGDVILGAVDEGRLLEAAFFEVLGMHDPDIMKFLPEEIAALVASWIEDTVLLD
jgi:tetratricopeptide (TPR) repeat protein